MFPFSAITEVRFEIYKVNDIQASSHIELPEEPKNSQSNLKIQSNDTYYFYGVYQVQMSSR